MEFKCPESNVGLCTSTSFKVYHTKLHFYGPTDTKLEKWSTQTQVHGMLSLWNCYISGAFLDKVMGVKGGVDFTEGFMKIQKLVRRAFMCVCFLFSFATLRRNKMRTAAWRRA
jgi:hypothetical protein